MELQEADRRSGLCPFAPASDRVRASKNGSIQPFHADVFVTDNAFRVMRLECENALA